MSIVVVPSSEGRASSSTCRDRGRRANMCQDNKVSSPTRGKNVFLSFSLFLLSISNERKFISFSLKTSPNSFRTSADEINGKTKRIERKMRKILVNTFTADTLGFVPAAGRCSRHLSVGSHEALLLFLLPSTSSTSSGDFRRTLTVKQSTKLQPSQPSRWLISCPFRLHLVTQ